MPTIIFSDQMRQPYSEFISDSLIELAKRKPKTIGIVAVCDDETVTGYWNADCSKLADMCSHIQADFIDRICEMNFTKYMEKYENGELE